MREKTVERENMKVYSPGVGFLLLPRVGRGVNPRDMKVFRPGIIQFVCSSESSTHPRGLSLMILCVTDWF